jgi:predicted enzyme related to lactoylglutathione lyase
MAYGSIMHFEINGDNLEKLRTFYSELFGWRFERAPTIEEYWLIKTSNLGHKDGIGINGGLTKSDSRARGVINYISVESIEDCRAKTVELGGRVLSPKTEVSDMGWYILVEDPEGNMFAIWEDMK